MKICPHCSQKIPDQATKCPSCGASYWEPEQDKSKELIETEETEEERGCLSLFFVPLFLSIVVAALLIIAGFVINLVVHFESNQVKIIWIGSSILIGFVLYLLLSKIKNQERGRGQ